MEGKAMVQHLTSLSILFNALALIVSFVWSNAVRQQKSAQLWKILFRVLVVLALVCILASNALGA